MGKTASAAKYACYREFSDAWDMTFLEFLKIIKVHKVGTFKPSDLFGDSESFERVCKNRNIGFAYMGMRIEVSGKMGTIVGSNSSCNLNVCFDGTWWSEKCHPWWKTRYFDREGNVIAEYAD
jgi:hypothetical protein